LKKKDEKKKKKKKSHGKRGGKRHTLRGISARKNEKTRGEKSTCHTTIDERERDILLSSAGMLLQGNKSGGKKGRDHRSVGAEENTRILKKNN